MNAISRVPQLPNEVVHSIFEMLWDIISTHPARDHAAVPPSPGEFYLSALLVNKNWHQLALPFFVRWWSRGNPDQILEYVKEKNVGPLVRHLTMRAYADIAHIGFPLRAAMWKEMFATCTHLASLTVRVDRLDTSQRDSEEERATAKSRSWIDVALKTLKDLPLEQRSRIRKLNLQFAHDLDVVEDWVIHSFAETLPNVANLMLQGFGTPNDNGELAIVKTGMVPETGASWWTGLQHVSLLHFQAQCDADEISIATDILTASAGSLLTITCDEFVQQLPLCPISQISEVLATSAHQYPKLQRLFVSGPPLVKGEETVLTSFPVLEHLNIPISARPSPHAADAVKPSLLDHLPPTLTHLTFTLDSMFGWTKPLTNYIKSGSALRYLAIDKEETPEHPWRARLAGLLPIGRPPPPPLSIDALRMISMFCNLKQIVFSCADERLWDGNEDLWQLDKDDEIASDGTGVESSCVEEVVDFDAEDDAIWASKWSAEKRRDMAIINFCEAMKLDLTPGVDEEDIRAAVAPYLRPLLKRHSAEDDWDSS